MEQLTLLLAEIHASAEAKQSQSGNQKAPICPDTSLPWLDDFAHNGWSAKMFLHQTMCSLSRRWRLSDTERVQFDLIPLRLQANTEPVISVSDQLCQIGFDHSGNFISSKAVKGLLLRSMRRHRFVSVLLRTDTDMIPATITYTKKDDCEFLTVQSASGLQDSQTDGLKNFLMRELQK